MVEVVCAAFGVNLALVWVRQARREGFPIVVGGAGIEIGIVAACGGDVWIEGWYAGGRGGSGGGGRGLGRHFIIEENTFGPQCF